MYRKNVNTETIYEATTATAGTSPVVWPTGILKGAGDSGTPTAVLWPTGIIKGANSTATPIAAVAADVATTLGVQNANKVYAGPSTGADAAPAFRTLAAADLGTTLGPTFATAHIGGASHYSSFEADGTLLMTGDATVWDDLRFPMTAINPAGSPSPMIFDTTLIGMSAAAAGTTVVAIIGQMPHSWKVASTITPHIHWMPTTADGGNVVWRLEYKWTNDGDAEAGSFTALTDVTAAAGTTQYKHIRTDFETISGSGKTMSSILTFKLSRIGGTGNDAPDTYPADVLVKEFDVHYEMDTLGSRSITTK